MIKGSFKVLKWFPRLSQGHWGNIVMSVMLSVAAYSA
jgi:hypothetical protein